MTIKSTKVKGIPTQTHNNKLHDFTLISFLIYLIVLIDVPCPPSPTGAMDPIRRPKTICVIFDNRE
jgi:hypothetical protein